MKESEIVKTNQKDLKDIRNILRIVYMVIEKLDRMKVTTADPTKEGKDLKEKENLMHDYRELMKKL